MEGGAKRTAGALASLRPAQEKIERAGSSILLRRAAECQNAGVSWELCGQPGLQKRIPTARPVALSMHDQKPPPAVSQGLCDGFWHPLRRRLEVVAVQVQALLWDEIPAGHRLKDPLRYAGCTVAKGGKRTDTKVLMLSGPACVRRFLRRAWMALLGSNRCPGWRRRSGCTQATGALCGGVKQRPVCSR